MKQKLISVILLMMLFCGITFAQSEMQVIAASGNSSTYLLSSISKQTFADGMMVIEFSDESSSVEYDMSEGVKVLFNTETSAIENLLSSNLDVALFPVPASGELFVAYNSAASAMVNVSIFSLKGQELISQSHSVYSGENQLSISLSGLNSGIYLCRISDGKQTLTQKFIKE